MLRIPYTGSRVLTNAIALDKTLTKRIWRDRRLPVAPFQEFTTGEESFRPELNFPLFVKPAREGTGMGVDMRARVENSETEMRERVKYVIQSINNPRWSRHSCPGENLPSGNLAGRTRNCTAATLNGMKPMAFIALPILELKTR